MKKRIYKIYLPKFNKEIMIKASSEASAIWKLFQLFRLREDEIDNYIIN